MSESRTCSGFTRKCPNKLGIPNFHGTIEAKKGTRFWRVPSLMHHRVARRRSLRLRRRLQADDSLPQRVERGLSAVF